MKVALAICLVIGSALLVGCGKKDDGSAAIDMQKDATAGSPTGKGAMPPSNTVETPTKVGG